METVEKKDYEVVDVKGEKCIICERPSVIHRGAPLCRKCAEEEDKMYSEIEDLKERWEERWRKRWKEKL